MLVIWKEQGEVRCTKLDPADTGYQHLIQATHITRKCLCEVSKRIKVSSFESMHLPSETTDGAALGERESDLTRGWSLVEHCSAL